MAKQNIQQTKYIVTLEGLVPVTLQYEVLAESQDDAFKIIDRTWPYQQLIGPPKYNLKAMKKKKIVIRERISGIVKLMKNYF